MRNEKKSITTCSPA